MITQAYLSSPFLLLRTAVPPDFANKDRSSGPDLTLATKDIISTRLREAKVRLEATEQMKRKEERKKGVCHHGQRVVNKSRWSREKQQQTMLWKCDRSSDSRDDRVYLKKVGSHFPRVASVSASLSQKATSVTFRVASLDPNPNSLCSIDTLPTLSLEMFCRSVCLVSDAFRASLEVFVRSVK